MPFLWQRSLADVNQGGAAAAAAQREGIGTGREGGRRLDAIDSLDWLADCVAWGEESSALRRGESALPPAVVRHWIDCLDATLESAVGSTG